MVVRRPSGSDDDDVSGEFLAKFRTTATVSVVEIERLNQEQEMALLKRKSEFETELENKRLRFEEEMETKRTLLDQREITLSEQELAFAQRYQSVGLRLAELARKEEALSARSDELKEEEMKLFSRRVALHIQLLKVREEIQKTKLDLEKEKAFFGKSKKNDNALLPSGENGHATPPNDLAFANGKVHNSDFVNTVCATEPSTGLIEGRHEQDEDADDEEEEVSWQVKLWRFLVT